MEIKVVMLSGGYDSTALLFWAVRHSVWRVFAHHVELRNVEHRWEEERAAVEAVKQYARDRSLPVEFSESAIENMDPWFCQRDIVNVGFMAATVAHGLFRRFLKHRPDIEVFTGGTLEDRVDEQMATHDGIYTKTKVFNTCVSNWPERFPSPKISIPFAQTPKAVVVKYIPEELLPHLWTCRAPVVSGGVVKRCGVCVSCARERLITRM